MGNNPFAQFNPGGNGSMQVNSQILPAPMMAAFFPNLAQAPIYKGNGQGPPTIPINYMSASSGDATANIAAANPWSFTQSPLPILIVALIVGLLWLRMVHWG